MGSLIYRPAPGQVEAAVVTCGGNATALTTALTNGSAVTSLAVNAIPTAVQSGDWIAVTYLGNWQVFTASGTAAINATAIAVTSLNANYSYPIGASVTDIGNLTQISWPGGDRQYTFTPGVSQEVVPEDYANVAASLEAIEGYNTTNPNAPVTAFTGTNAATTYTYVVVAVMQGGDSPEGTASTPITTGSASLNGTSNYVTITKPTSMPSKAYGWRVIRTVGTGGVGDISGVLPLTQATLVDGGQTAVAYTAITIQPGVALVTSGPADQ